MSFDYIMSPTVMSEILAFEVKYFDQVLCSCDMVPAKPTVCHRVVNFVRTVEHGEGTRRSGEHVADLLAASETR